MSKIKVGLIFGGKSGEHEVSIVSAASIYNALDKDKYDITLIGIDKDGRWLLPSDPQLLATSNDPRSINLSKEKNTITVAPFNFASQIFKLSDAHHGLNVDVFFPVLHGTNGEDGTVQGLLELTQLPYVGSGVLGSAIGMDKDVARRLLKEAQIPVVETLTFTQEQFKANPEGCIKSMIKQLSLPFFIKPANAGSSVGVHKIKTKDEALLKIPDAFQFDNKILAEEAIDARELECAILGNENPKASIVGEIVPSHEFYTYEAKYLDQNGAELFIPAQNLTAKLSKAIQETSIAAYKCLELTGLARVDFLLDKKSGDFYLNEVNTLPGFTSISMYPKLWEASGVSYPELLNELIRLAIDLKKKKKALKTTYE